jgi:hypothetical protein
MKQKFSQIFIFYSSSYVEGYLFFVYVYISPHFNVTFAIYGKFISNNTQLELFLVPHPVSVRNFYPDNTKNLRHSSLDDVTYEATHGSILEANCAVLFQEKCEWSLASEANFVNLLKPCWVPKVSYH